MYLVEVLRVVVFLSIFGVRGGGDFVKFILLRVSIEIKFFLGLLRIIG